MQKLDGLTRPALFSALAAFTIALTAALAISAPAAPSVFSPWPVPLFLLSALGLPAAGIAVTCAAIFVLWQPGLFVGARVLPVRSTYLFLAGLIGSVAYYALAHEAALSHQGRLHFLACTAINAALITAIVMTGRRAQKQPGSHWALGAQWLLFLWLFSFALPYFGEGP